MIVIIAVRDQKFLPTETTALVHGRAAAEEAAATARTTFEEGGLGASLPSVEVSSADLKAGLSVLGRLTGSNGDARRAIANNAILINDVRVTSEKAVIGEADVTKDGVVKLSLGRKRHVLLKPI